MFAKKRPWITVLGIAANLLFVSLVLYASIGVLDKDTREHSRIVQWMFGNDFLGVIFAVLFIGLLISTLICSIGSLITEPVTKFKSSCKAMVFGIILWGVGSVIIITKVWLLIGELHILYLSSLVIGYVVLHVLALIGRSVFDFRRKKSSILLAAPDSSVTAIAS